MPGTAREIACQDASARAITQYGRRTGVTQACPACGDRISVHTVDSGMWVSVVTDCTCRTCAGKFRLPAPRGRRGALALGKRLDGPGP